MKKIIFSIAVLCLVSSANVMLSYAKALPSKEYMATQEIFQSPTLSKEQKLQRLERFLNKYPVRTAYLLIELDRGAAREIILRHFRDAKISKTTKLVLGRGLLQVFDAQEVAPEFKKFLVKDILEKIDEFMHPQEFYADSGLAEYVYIASEFNGYHDPKLFDALKDERTVPNLIKALNAPDQVWSKDREDMSGIPGTSTGRNVPRQLIPIALAKLNATSAIPDLKDKFKKHYDKYLRATSAYALGYLLGKDEKEDFEKQLSKEKDQNIIFEFAKGSIAVRDYSVLKYIRLDRNVQPKDFGILSCLYEIEQKLRVLNGVKDPGTKAFYSELIAYEPFRELVAADYTKIPVEEKEWQTYFKSKDDYLNKQMHRIVKIYSQLVQGVELNGSTDLWADVKMLGGNSLSPDIQNIAKAFCVRSTSK